MELIAIFCSLSEPSAFPRLVDAKTKTYWMNFSTHNFSWCLFMEAE
jgi:hypothetical protein